MRDTTFKIILSLAIIFSLTSIIIVLQSMIMGLPNTAIASQAPQGQVLGASISNTDFIVPADAGVINIKNQYGAKGDGTTDDTAAIIAAIRANLGNDKIIYFPNGTYLVSNTLDWKDNSGAWHSYLAFQGQNQTNTIIKLKNSASGFGNSGSPKAVIYTASEQADGQRADGGGDEAYNIHIADMTIDTGTGNPGAIGIDYIGSNQSYIERVTIRSGDGQGQIGLALTRPYTGPEIIKNLTVSGFNYGIKVGYPLSSATFEHITLQNQKIAGFFNGENVVSIRDLTSINSVPAIINSGFPALLTLLDSNLSGGSSGNNAINNSDNAKMYLRNITTSGYGKAANNNGTLVAGPNILEFVSSPVTSLFTSPMTSLNLPIQETPDFQEANLSNWANVKSYGATANDSSDDTVAIQKALDSGKTVVYFPAGKYRINNSLRVRSAVRKIIGFTVQITPLNASSPVAVNSPAFIFEGTSSNPVILELVKLAANWDLAPSVGFAQPSVVQTGSQTLVLKHLISNYSYRAQSGAGNVFVEDVCCGTFEFVNQNAWARQLNPETTNTHVINNGANLWLLGLKTEQNATIIETKNGGKTELLGAFVSMHSNQTYVPFINTESSHSLIFAGDTSYTWANAVQETRGGVTKLLPSSSLPARGYGTITPLYVGYVAFQPSPDTQAPVVSLSSPANNASVSGSAVTVSASASDNVGVTGVQFMLDGANLGTEDTSSPYTVTWNTTQATNGSHSLSARVRDAAGNTATASITVSVNNTSGQTSTYYLSDLTWASSSNGWGPVEKDKSNGEQAAGDGRPITLNGAQYAKGLGTNANSNIIYNISNCSTFTADVGVDDEVTSPPGSVVFQVWGNGNKLFDSGTMTANSFTKNVSVPLSGVSVLKLMVTDAGDGDAYDHADWANAKIVCDSNSN